MFLHYCGYTPTSLHAHSYGQEYFPLELSPSIVNPVREVIGSLRELGASILPVSLPSTSYALSSYYVLASAEASSNLARYDGTQYGMYDFGRTFVEMNGI